MAPDGKAGRVVFIGNIPYGLTEEQIIHTFSTVGQVLNFRLVYDRETGKPKGFGFAEFSDADAAASAVRNLNDYEIMGRRLRVDYSHEGGEDDGQGSTSNSQTQGTNGSLSSQQQSSSLGYIPPGIDLPAGITCPDAISRTLSSLPAPQLLDILTQMKALVMSDPTKATELLRQAPQLSYALFQALLLMGLVDTNILSSVVEQAATANQQSSSAASAPATSTVQSNSYQSQPQFAQAFQHIQNPSQVPTPPMATQSYQPPPSQQTATAQTNQQELFKQVLAMSPEQISMLPPLERSQILVLRQQLLGTQGSFQM